MVRNQDTLDHLRRARCRTSPGVRRLATGGPAKDVDPIKIEGIRESGTGIVVTYDPSRGGQNILGRHRSTTPACSRRCSAIQNLWLAAAAENIGVGWVSFYDEEYLTDCGHPAPVRPSLAVRRQGGPVPGGSGSGTLRLADASGPVRRDPLGTFLSG
ncbi:hypothetical protein GS508_19825 [Rhodococcus hoagii]|nr:hypothetical protein [Prescottella equi]